jgi:hypothetical protein
MISARRAFRQLVNERAKRDLFYLQNRPVSEAKTFCFYYITLAVVGKYIYFSELACLLLSHVIILLSHVITEN